MEKPNKQTLDIIDPRKAKTLYGLFAERVKRTPQRPAYSYLDLKTKKWNTLNWSQMEELVGQWVGILKNNSLEQDSKVALWSRNSVEWVAMDLASNSLGLIIVPLYFDDRAENVAYILENSGAEFLMLENIEQWNELKEVEGFPWNLKRAVSTNTDKEDGILKNIKSSTITTETKPSNKENLDGSKLATIVYTSGTTGNPKGVMLSSINILENVYSGLKTVPCYLEDRFFSFLPLSHTFERTAGYYLSMMAGSSVTFCRSKHKIAEDIELHSPTVMLAVPRFFEKIYTAINLKVADSSFVKRKLFALTLTVGWKRFKYNQNISGYHPLLLLYPLLDKVVAQKIRAKLGGKLRLTISGGAALPYGIAKMFLSLGINIIQGYGMTETSPIVSVNPTQDNNPLTVGKPLEGVDIKIGANEELLVKGSNVMLGYWNNIEATNDTIDPDGWLHSGDKAEIIDGHIKIKGRIKEIIVLSNGEKVPPADVENAIESDPIIDQVAVAGEAKPFIVAFIVISEENLKKTAKTLKIALDDNILKNPKLEAFFITKIDALMHRFPGFARIRRCAIYTTAWTIEDGLLTPTLKLKRNKVLVKLKDDFELLYKGHQITDFPKKH